MMPAMARPKWIVLISVTLACVVLIAALLVWHPWTDDTSSGNAASPPPADPTSVFLSFGHDTIPNKTDDELEAVGRGICREFADGITWTNIITGLISDGEIDARQAGGLVAISVTALCPRFERYLP